MDELASLPPAAARGGRLAVVLSGGGARAAYQVGLFRFLGRARPDLRFDVVTGVSAGAINAAFLASHRGTMAEAAEQLADLWCQLTFDRVFNVETAALGTNVARWGLRLLSGGSHMAPTVRALLDTSPLRRLLTTIMTTVNGEIIGIHENLRRGRLQAVALGTLNYGTGQTVTWVQGENVELWQRPHRRSAQARIAVDHVMASSALPLLFPAVRLGNGWYGDGGVRQAAPLAPAIHLGAQRIIAISTRYPRSQGEADRPVITGYPPPAQVLGAMINSIFLDVVEQDALHLQRINRLVEAMSPEQRGALRPIRLLVLQPSQDLGRLAGAYERELPKGVRFLTRGLGTRETASPDFLSLLMFHPEYVRDLVAIGEADAESAAETLLSVVDDTESESEVA